MKSNQLSWSSTGGLLSMKLSLWPVRWIITHSFMSLIILISDSRKRLLVHSTSHLTDTCELICIWFFCKFLKIGANFVRPVLNGGLLISSQLVVTIFVLKVMPGWSAGFDSVSGLTRQPNVTDRPPRSPIRTPGENNKRCQVHVKETVAFKGLWEDFQHSSATKSRQGENIKKNLDVF